MCKKVRNIAVCVLIGRGGSTERDGGDGAGVCLFQEEEALLNEMEVTGQAFVCSRKEMEVTGQAFVCSRKRRLY